LVGNVIRYDDGQLSDTLNATAYVNGHSYIYDYVDNGVHAVIVARFDLEYQAGKVYVPVFSSENEGACQDSEVPQHEADQQRTGALYYFLKVQKFDGMNRSTYNGVECNMYYRGEGGVDARLYASDDGHVIAVVDRQDEGNYFIMETSFSYDFPMDVFALQESQFPGCSPSAYTAPTDQCN